MLDHGEAFFELERNSTRPLRVMAGAFAVLARESVFAVRVDINRKLQWTHGQLEFSGEPLADAIADPTISSLTIGGKFSATDVDAFVAALRDLGVNPMSAESGDANIIRLVASQRREQ